MSDDQWEKDKQWLQQVIGSGQQAPTQAPSGLPAGIPVGRPYVTGSNGRNLRFIVPPPPDEVARQIAVEQAKAQAKASARPIPSHQMDTIRQTQEAAALLDDIIADMEKHNYKTGPLSPRFYSGPVGNIAMQYRGSKEESSFKKKVKDYQNIYSHVQTGANRGFREIEFLNAAIPGVDQDVPDKFLDASYQARDRLKMNEERMKALLEESGYNTSKLNRSKTNEDPYVAEARRRGLIK